MVVVIEVNSRADLRGRYGCVLDIVLKPTAEYSCCEKVDWCNAYASICDMMAKQWKDKNSNIILLSCAFLFFAFSGTMSEDHTA